MMSELLELKKCCKDKKKKISINNAIIKLKNLCGGKDDALVCTQVAFDIVYEAIHGHNPR